jgi:Uma2 family endonuclease
MARAGKAVMSTVDRPPRRWTVAEYHNLADMGVFGPEERLELVDGEILCMSPPKGPYATASDLTESALREVFRTGYRVRVQKPLTLGGISEPEPDIAVVRGAARDFVRSHPTTAELVVEVADTSLAFDRGPKAQLYARAGLPDYWVLNLPERVLEVYREPDAATEQYRSVTRCEEADTIAALAAPDARIRVADLLP